MLCENVAAEAAAASRVLARESVSVASHSLLRLACRLPPSSLSPLFPDRDGSRDEAPLETCSSLGRQMHALTHPERDAAREWDAT